MSLKEGHCGGPWVRMGGVLWGVSITVKHENPAACFVPITKSTIELPKVTFRSESESDFRKLTFGHSTSLFSHEGSALRLQDGEDPFLAGWQRSGRRCDGDVALEWSFMEALSAGRSAGAAGGKGLRRVIGCVRVPCANPGAAVGERYWRISWQALAWGSRQCGCVAACSELRRAHLQPGSGRQLLRT